MCLKTLNKITFRQQSNGSKLPWNKTWRLFSNKNLLIISSQTLHSFYESAVVIDFFFSSSFTETSFLYLVFTLHWLLKCILFCFLERICHVIKIAELIHRKTKFCFICLTCFCGFKTMVTIHDSNYTYWLFYTWWKQKWQAS